MRKTLALLFCVILFTGVGAWAECPSLMRGSDSRTEWRLSSHQPARAAAIVVHGLNTNPEKMDTIENILREDRIDVLHVSLAGHNNNMNAFQRVSATMWEKDILHAYCLAEQRARQYGMPLYYVGFSLGGVVGLAAANKYPLVHYDKMVLFAPAVSMRRTNFMLRILNKMNPLTIIPNVFNRAYFSNSIGTPVSAYKAVFDLSRWVTNHTSQKISNVPTLVFIDPRDELLNPLGLSNYIQRHRLSKWKTFYVNKTPFSPLSIFHHLLIDDKTVGTRRWSEMKSAMLAHLDE